MTLDWPTLALQTINVLVLIWLLQKFFWRPVSGMIEQRRAAAQTMLDGAAKKRDEAQAAAAEIAATRAGFAQERQAILAAAAAEAAQHHAAALAAETVEIQAQETAARERLAAGQRTAEAAWRQQAGALAVDIAGKLAARLNGAAVQAAFLEWLAADLAAQHVPAGEPLTLVSAAPLSPAEQAACAQRLATTLGTGPQLSFQADPSLIAGLELRGPTLLVRNSWRADLDRILAELAHDKP